MFKKSLWLCLVILIFITMIVNPKAVFIAALDGIEIWAKILVPALLPFFIIANLLTRLGFINLVGALLEPVMRPFFNVSGAGGFVLAIGFTSGFPISSLLTADLRQQGKLTKDEAERLMSFTNNASPLFMFSAISIGMFNTPELGLILAAGHYLSNLLIGFILGFFSRKKRKIISYNHNIFKKAYYGLLETPNQPIGQVLFDAINKAIKSIIAIGGFVMLFAITISAFTVTNIFFLLNSMFAIILVVFGFDASLAPALSKGLFEVTLGVKTVSETSTIYYQQVAITAAILAWSGLSIHAQVASFISKTDISLVTFIYSRLAQSILAPVITLFFLSVHKTGVIQMQNTISENINFLFISPNSSLGLLAISSTAFLGVLLILLLLSLVLILLTSLKRLIYYYF